MKTAPWLLSGSVLLGIALGTSSYIISFPSAVFLGVGFCLLLVRTFRISQPHFILFAFVLFLLTFWYGQERLQYFDTLVARETDDAWYRVMKLPEEKSFYQTVIVGSLRSPKILWQAPLDVELAPGDRISLQCELSIPENFTPDFDYRRYLAKEGIGYICEQENAFHLTEEDRITKLYQLLYTPRSLLEKGIHRSIPEPEAGLAKGLLLGGSSHLSTIVQEQFTHLGLTHIVAVSGYNIVLIVNALLGLGLTLYLWRKQATIFAFLGTAFFILMIGAPASAVRAGIMATAAFGAFLIGRMQYSLLAVVLTASLMTLWNPLYLWYDAGFQLSFLATIAVIVSMRAIDAHLSAHTFIKALQEIIWLSVWVYLFLLPILLLQFGTFTVFSVPANIVFLPFVPIAMLGSFVAALSALIFPPASVIVGWIAYLPLTFILRGTYALNQFPDITIPVHISLITVIIWYIALLFGTVYMEERRRQKQYEKNFRCPNRAHHH